MTFCHLYKQSKLQIGKKNAKLPNRHSIFFPSRAFLAGFYNSQPGTRKPVHTGKIYPNLTVLQLRTLAGFFQLIFKFWLVVKSWESLLTPISPKKKGHSIKNCHYHFLVCSQYFGEIPCANLLSVSTDEVLSLCVKTELLRRNISELLCHRNTCTCF